MTTFAKTLAFIDALQVAPAKTTDDLVAQVGVSKCTAQRWLARLRDDKRIEFVEFRKPYESQHGPAAAAWRWRQ